LNNNSQSNESANLFIFNKSNLNRLNPDLIDKIVSPKLNVSSNKIIRGDSSIELSVIKDNLKKNTFSSMMETNSMSSSASIPTSTTMPMTMPPVMSIKRASYEKRMKFNLVHSKISGIKLKLGGRLEKTLIIPRKSSQEVLMGHISRGSTAFKNTSTLTYKNNRGAYSITVESSYLNLKA
jgi:hypothetical protein